MPASASSAGIWLTKDSQNTLIIEKHRDVTNPQYNTNLFIVERVNGNDSFVYVSSVPPSANFDIYKIRKIPTGYEVYYNGSVVYTGNLDLSTYNMVEIVGITRASGDQIEGQFKNYQEQ
ncbi:MAG: hypothetical protein FJY86_04520 [Candidatus Diapherotrites archaeon]|uniref:Uncharacterized protein n=1 Tax=Candidatus Iainarchaeum sp. TaxID=3101447 RepID=A0A8T4C7Z9_9ARCH|nr:hypothetical protein [Candidatus Diapherotrites archaeon]